MKFTLKLSLVMTALAMATAGVLVNTTQVKASTVATVNSGVVARLYASNGNLITNRALSPNSAWAVGKTATINGETMYQVATNEYLRAQDSSLAGQAQQSSTKIAGKATTLLPLFRDDTNKMADRSLAPNSEWAIGKYIVNKNGQQFVQVSTHEYADASNLTYNYPMTNPTYITDFGINTNFSVVGSMNMGNGWGTGDDSDNTNTDNQNQDSTSTDTSTPPTGTGNTNSVNTPMPSATDVQSAVFASINAERRSKGLEPVTTDSTLTAIAQKRAQEISTNFTHYDANGNEIFKKYLHEQTSYLSQGENISGDHWIGLHTPAELADSIMDSFRAEGTDASWNHYKAIINPNATKVGIGVFVSSDGDHIYTTEDFAG